MIAVMLPYPSNVLPSIHQRHPTAGASSYEVLLDDRLSWGKALLDSTLFCLPVHSSSPPLTHHSCFFMAITVPDWSRECLWNHIQNIILNIPNLISFWPWLAMTPFRPFDRTDTPELDSDLDTHSGRVEEIHLTHSPFSVLATTSVNRSEMTPYFHKYIRNSLDFLSQLIIEPVRNLLGFLMNEFWLIAY